MMVMIPLLGLIGLGSDIGLLYFHWGILQKAADAAVLAGAGYLPNHPSTAQTTAREALQKLIDSCTKETSDRQMGRCGDG